MSWLRSLLRTRYRAQGLSHGFEAFFHPSGEFGSGSFEHTGRIADDGEQLFTLLGSSSAWPDNSSACPLDSVASWIWWAQTSLRLVTRACCCSVNLVKALVLISVSAFIDSEKGSRDWLSIRRCRFSLAFSQLR